MRPGPLKIGIQIRAGDGLLGDIAINLDTYRPFFNCADQLEVRFAAGSLGRQGFQHTSAIILDTRQLFFPRADQLEAVQTRANVTIAGVIRPAPEPRGEAGGGGKQGREVPCPSSSTSCWHRAGPTSLGVRHAGGLSIGEPGGDLVPHHRQHPDSKAGAPLCIMRMHIRWTDNVRLLDQGQ